VGVRAWKSKVDKSDALLRSICGLYAVIVTVSQYIVGGKVWCWFCSYFAILFFVVGIPLYVAYVRGAITVDSLVERARGWIYLVFGTVSYLTWIWVWFEGELSIFVMALSTAIMFSLAVALTIAAPAFGGRIMMALGGRPDASSRESFTRTGHAIMWMTFLLVFVTVNPASGLDTTSRLIATLVIVGVSVSGIWNAEKWARLSEKGYMEKKGQMRNGRITWLMIVGMALLLISGPFYLMGSRGSLESRLASAAIIIGALLILGPAILLGGWKIRRTVYKVK